MSLLPGFPNICASSPWKPSPSWIWTLGVCGNEREQLRTAVVSGAELSSAIQESTCGCSARAQPKFHYRCPALVGASSTWQKGCWEPIGSGRMPFFSCSFCLQPVPGLSCPLWKSQAHAKSGFAAWLISYHRHVSSAVIKLISSCYFPISNHSKKTDFPLLNTGSITLGSVNGLSKDFSTYRRVTDSLSICCIKPMLKSQL